VPGARVGFLACPRKPTKRRTPRRLGPAGLIAARSASRTGNRGRVASTRRPVAANLVPASLPARPCDSPLARQGVRGLTLRFRLLRASNARGCLCVQVEGVSRGLSAHGGERRLFPLDGLPHGRRVAWGRSDMDVAPRLSATGGRVEPAPRQPVVVRLRGRTCSGLEGPKGQAVGCLSFRVFSWTSKKRPSRAE